MPPPGAVGADPSARRPPERGERGGGVGSKGRCGGAAGQSGQLPSERHSSSSQKHRRLRDGGRRPEKEKTAKMAENQSAGKPD